MRRDEIARVVRQDYNLSPQPRLLQPQGSSNASTSVLIAVVYQGVFHAFGTDAPGVTALSKFTGESDVSGAAILAENWATSLASWMENGRPL